jgi:hypothetical protein
VHLVGFIIKKFVMMHCHMNIKKITYIVSEITFVLIPPWNVLHMKLIYSEWNAEVSVHSPDCTKIHLHNNITNTVSRNSFWQNGEQYLRKWHFSLWTLSLTLQSYPRCKTEAKLTTNYTLVFNYYRFLSKTKSRHF